MPALDDCALLIGSITSEDLASSVAGGVPGGNPPPAANNAPATSERSPDELILIARETLKSSALSDNRAIAFWIPSEYWRVSFAKFRQQARLQPAMEAQLESLLKALDSYTLVAVGHAKVSGGNYAYFSEKELRSSVQLLDSEGNAYGPVSEEELNPDTKRAMSFLRPRLVKVATELADYGENIHVFAFPSTARSGRKIADGKNNGAFSLRLGRASFNWETPVTALLPPK
jgi:hypothetical protein